MARLARVVVPGLPHHVTQRGNRREPIVFEDGDQDVYLDLLAKQTRKAAVEVWAYCLMPNHVHLVLTPAEAAGPGRAMGEAHRRYATFIDARGRWIGHLFQGRYASVAMDEDPLIAAVRYVSLNPVRARLVSRAEDWPWSSVRAHLAGRDDGVTRVKPVLDRVTDFAGLVANDGDGRSRQAEQAIRASKRTGRPLGNAEFVADLARILERPIARRALGRKPDTSTAGQPSLFA